MFSLPAHGEVLFLKVNRDLVNKIRSQVTPRCYPKSAPVCSSASWHRSEHSMSHPPTVVAGHLSEGWVFWGGCFYCRGKEGWLNLLKLQESFHGNSYWKEVAVGVSWGAIKKTLEFGSYTHRSPGRKNGPALDDSGCFSNWYGIVRSSKLLEYVE